MSDEKFSSIQPLFDLLDTPAFITGNNVKLFAGYGDNHILIYDKTENKILNSLTLPCNNSVNFRFSVDANENIAFSCPNDNGIRLVSASGVNLGEQIKVQSPSSVMLDSKGRLIVTTSKNGLNVFY